MKHSRLNTCSFSNHNHGRCAKLPHSSLLRCTLGSNFSILRLSIGAMPMFIWHEAAKRNYFKRRLRVALELFVCWRLASRRNRSHRVRAALQLVHRLHDLTVQRLLLIQRSRRGSVYTLEYFFEAWFLEAAVQRFARRPL